MKNKKVVIVLLSFFILLSAAFMTYFYSVTKIDKKPLPFFGEAEHRIRSFSFVNQVGETVTEQTTKDKIYVVEYFFATCEGICPKMNENLNTVYQQFKGNSNVLFLSHTVDPEEDSTEALRKYALQFEADPKQWHFLTGDKKALYDQARYSYLISAQDDTSGVSIDKDFIHDNHFVLVDRNARIRGVYDGLLPTEMVRLVGDIKILLQSKD